MNEFDFIHSLFGGATTPYTIGDDAVLCGNFVIAKDIMAEGVHFTLAEPLQSIINRLFISNISDIAAVGGKNGNYNALLGLSIPNYVDKHELSQAIRAAAARFKVNLIGGDTISSPHGLFLSLTIIGEANAHFISRSGAKVGDTLYISRPVGMAKYELERLGVYQTERLPECELGDWMGHTGGVNACIDISDGLGRDLSHIAAASGVKIVIDEKLLPNYGQIDTDYIISSGEEYALVFTTNKTPLYGYPIGKVETGKGIWLGECNISQKGYEHTLNLK